MVIPDKVNFLQLGRYGKFSEQTYRNHFEKDFDWFEFNKSLIKRHLIGKRKAIAIDPSYIPKSGKKTPWIGYFWSGCAAEYKRGLEIIWYQNENKTNKWQIYFSTDDTMNAKEIIEYYRTRFQIEFCFRDAKQYAGLNNCQSTDFRKLHYHFNASFTAINLANATCKTLKIPYSISNCKTIIPMLICSNDLFACLGYNRTRKLLTNFSKNLFYSRLKSRN